MREFQDDNTFRKAVQPPRQIFFEFLSPSTGGEFLRLQLNIGERF